MVNKEKNYEDYKQECKDRPLSLEENMYIADTIVHELIAFSSLDAEERYYLVRSVEALIEQLKKNHKEQPVSIWSYK